MALSWERRGTYIALVGKPYTDEKHEDLGVDRRIILKGLFKKYNGSFDWIDLAQDRDKERSLVNTEIKLTAP